MISQKTIDEVLAASRIEEVVGDFISLKKKGQNWVGVCPFHDDKNPSLSVSPRLGIYKCFVCDAKGNAAKFLMEYDKLSYPDAIRYLAQKYGIPVEEDAPKSNLQLEIQNEADSMFALNLFAENYFISQLFDTDEGRNVGLTYLKERGLNEAIIKKFKLGYSPNQWDAFTREAIKSQFKEIFLLKTGLTKKSENEGKLFDFFKGRVIFPIHNPSGKTVGFGGRILSSEKKNIAKYFNSPESEIYHKREILYGFDLAKKTIRQKDNVYLVEGYTDVISMHAAGVENVVASSGTALTEEQIKIISYQTKNITVLYDGDKAGIKAALRGIDMLLKSGLNVKVLLLPDGEDPDSFARKQQDDSLLNYLLDNATNFITFKAKILYNQADDATQKAAVVNEIIENITEIPDIILRSFYIKECASLFKITEEDLNEQLKKVIWSKIRKQQQNSQDPVQIIDPKVFENTKKFQPILIDNLQSVAKLIIILVLKYGKYEVDVQETNDNGSAFIAQMRVDQYIFDEFNTQNLQFKDPLLQKIFLEYAKIASYATSQEQIINFFTNHQDPEIANFTCDSLFNSDPAISHEWEDRFDITTRFVANNINKLNAEVENCINMFKLRIIEQYLLKLNTLLEDELPPDNLNSISIQWKRLNQRKMQLAKALGIVITQ